MSYEANILPGTSNDSRTLVLEEVGEVTLLEDCLSKGVINGIYFFKKEDAGPDIRKGSKVQFTARLSGDVSPQWEVISLKLYISPDDIAKEYRRKFITIIGKVIGIDELGALVKYGRNKQDDVQTVPIACLPQDYEVWIGDFLKLKLELNDPNGEDTGGKIHSVLPTNKKKIIGHVAFTNGRCCIDNYIYFDQRVCVNGRYPKVRETVRVVAVESQQERFTWRAVSVEPSRCSESTVPGTEIWRSASCSDAMLDLMKDTNRVQIEPKCLEFPDAYVGSPVTSLFNIQNISMEPITLVNTVIKGDQGVCRFTVGFEDAEYNQNTVIQPQTTLKLQITCYPGMVGNTREMIVFDFGEFEIGRQLAVTTLPTELDLMKQLTINERSEGSFANGRGDDAYSKMTADVHRPVVRGVQALRSPFFMQKRLENNFVPEYMWTILEKEDNRELSRKHPGAFEDLRIQNYQDKFRAALWLEEMENHVIRRQYDVENVTMRYGAGDLLAFEVPGLKDIHPPVLTGDPVSALDLTDPTETRYEGYIDDIRGEEVVVKFDDRFRKSYRKTPVTIRFCLGRTIYKRCHYAIEQAVRHLGEDWLFPYEPVSSKLARIPFIEVDSDDEDIPPSTSTTLPCTNGQELNLSKSERGMTKGNERQKLIGRRSLNRRITSLPGRFESDTQGASGEALKLTWFNKSLNQQQKDAVRRILRGQGRPLPYIVYGPPGTGKTVTVVESIIQVNKLDKNSRVLVVTPSNSAADVIATYLVASEQFGIGDFVRLVGFLRSELQIPEIIRDYCKDGEFLDAIARHRLIVCTCMTAGQFFQLGLDTGHFTHVFIDEAGYCTEPEALIGASLVALDKSGQVILAGDPKQLGPVLMSEAAGNCGLATSLLERLMTLPLYSRNEQSFPKDKYNPILLTKLVKNYRAHPTLIKLPSELFYDDELEPAAPVEAINLCESLDFLKLDGQSPTPLLFHGIQGTCTRDTNSPSWYNPAEVIQVVDYVRLFRKNGIPSENIGIITPYRKQVEKLRSTLELGLLTDNIPKVGSVEEFQGGERQVMIMSLVRSATKRELEKVVDRMTFVFSPKRFNVAVTRAKAVLIVLGNPLVLVHDPIWRSFLKYCVDRGCYTGCELPKQSLEQIEKLDQDW